LTAAWSGELEEDRLAFALKPDVEAVHPLALERGDERRTARRLQRGEDRVSRVRLV
jgi:hypothetical protein